MTRFEWFEAGYGRIGVELGIVSTSVFAKYIHYKMYLNHRARGIPHMEAIYAAADEAKTSVTTVWKSFYFFGKPTSTD